MKIDNDVEKNTGRKLAGEKSKNVKSEEVLIDESNYTTVLMLYKEIIKSVEDRKETRRSSNSYMNAADKCEICVEPFDDYNELERHNLELHVAVSKIFYIITS